MFFWKTPWKTFRSRMFSPLGLSMSNNVKRCTVLHVQQPLSGRWKLKASFSDNGPSPCQLKPCQPRCQFGTALVLALDDSRALKHNVGGGKGHWEGGFQFIDVCARFPNAVCFEAARHSSLSATSPALLPLVWAAGTIQSSENSLCMHRSTGHALTFYIYSQAVHETRVLNISPRVSF